MACPWFVPDEPFGPDAPVRPARAPLGAVYSGHCELGHLPGTHEVIELCNFGYARSRCTGFSDAAGCDAVRFSQPRDGGPLTWIREASCAPVAHGRICEDEIGSLPMPLRAQASAFLRHYRSR